MAKIHGGLYSRQYLKPIVTEDSKRARTRYSALSRKLFGKYENLKSNFSQEVESKLGVRIRTTGAGFSFKYLVDNWLDDCELRDFLDSVTILYAFLSDEDKSALVAAVNSIFKEEMLPFSVDENGGVHRVFDQEFESNTEFVFKVLEEKEYRAAGAEFQKGLNYLRSTSPDTISAVRAVYGAIENIFKIRFDESRLGPTEVRKKLLPVVEERYSERHKNSATLFLKSFSEWINACQQYRHADDEREHAEIPLEYAVALISSGASYLRWLLDIESKA
ncbi:MAG: hypothetical protein DHS20C05_24790 [Hyphococcus sp.]|nr:MAG: hypothetical protein DHS20C05_24790 [Marinicaulis sp.]